jgi:hypothetical protein
MLHKLLQTAFSHCERSLTIGSLHSERGVGILRFSVLRMGRERGTFLMTHLRGNVSSLPSVLETWEGKIWLAGTKGTDIWRGYGLLMLSFGETVAVYV